MIEQNKKNEFKASVMRRKSICKGVGLLALIFSINGCSPNTTSDDIKVVTKTNVVTETKDYTAKGWLSQTLPELSAALKNGDVSSEELVKAYLARISAIDENGPTLQSVLSVNPDAIDQAKAIDARRADGENLSELAGIPVLLKDNIETKDSMPTTAGALVLKNNMTRRDSPLAAGLRSQGAIIIGKTNLSQWANFRSNDSVSGWSALGGQVRNPHMLDRSPCGSSSGTGAAIAASLAAGGVGTETNGSVICPSNVNGVVGFKPTVGLVPQKYIVPISVSQDTAGPMTKTVRGAAMMLSAMATNDDGTSLGRNYTETLSDTALRGKRVGVLRFSEGSNADVIDMFNTAIKAIEAEGAIIVEIAEFDLETENYGRKSLDVLLYEFKDGLNSYLADAAPGVPAKTLADVIAFNKNNADFEMAVFDQSLFDQAEEKGALTDETYITARDDIQLATGKLGIDKLMSENNVEVLIGPSGPVASRVDPINGDVWPSWAGAGYLAAVSGYPNLTVPMGDVHGIPVGLSFMGGKDQDAKILAFGYDYEQASSMRRDPQYLKSAEDRPELNQAMKK